MPSLIPEKSVNNNNSNSSTRKQQAAGSEASEPSLFDGSKTSQDVTPGSKSPASMASFIMPENTLRDSQLLPKPGPPARESPFEKTIPSFRLMLLVARAKLAAIKTNQRRKWRKDHGIEADLQSSAITAEELLKYVGLIVTGEAEAE
jgi:hypothetical protein